MPPLTKLEFEELVRKEVNRPHAEGYFYCNQEAADLIVEKGWLTREDIMVTGPITAKDIL